jgi:hypothetical protein
MKNKALIFACLGFLCSGIAWAKPSTIVMVEDEKYFYKNKTMQKFEGQYEYTFLLDLEDNKMIRTRVYDYQTKNIKSSRS